MRSVSLLLVAVWLGLATTVFAQSSPDTQSTAPSDSQPVQSDQAPSGPVLQPADLTPIVCDPGAAAFRFVEVRGSGFDAWATQHLVGNVLDANGAPRIHWSSVWVSPQGQLTLEVNLCADPFAKRPALATGDYTVAVNQSNGANIAATGISIVPPPEPGTTDETAPPTPASPRIGSGSLQQPWPLGAPGNLVDGWQLAITGVTPDAFTSIQSAVPSATKPASDQRDDMLRVQATYLGQGTGVFGGVRLALLSTSTQLTYDQIKNSCGVIPDPLTPSVVAQGQTVRGNVCFTVRAADIGSLLAFDNQASDSDRAYFALQ